MIDWLTDPELAEPLTLGELRGLGTHPTADELLMGDEIGSGGAELDDMGAGELPDPKGGVTLPGSPDELELASGGVTLPAEPDTLELPLPNGGVTLLATPDTVELPVPKGGVTELGVVVGGGPEALLAEILPWEVTDAPPETELLPETDPEPETELLLLTGRLFALVEDPMAVLLPDTDRDPRLELLPDGATEEEDGKAVGWSSHDSLIKLISVPTTRDAVVPSTSTTSVKTGGKGDPFDAHGTGMISTRVPMVVVRVEQAVTVPVGTISPLVMKTSGGACGIAYTESRGRNGSIEKKVAISAGLTKRRSFQFNYNEQGQKNGKSV